MKGLLSFVCLLLWAGIAFADCGLEENCSDHGLCVEEQCRCNPNWAGDDCSIYDKVLNSEEIAVDTVKEKEWKFYRHQVMAVGHTLTWWMNLTEGTSGDPDLYIQLGTYPTKREYLTRNLTRSDNSYLLQQDLELGTYYAGVYGWSDAHYSIVVIESANCQDNCNSHGSCVNGVCECFTNFRGEFCQLESQPLTSGTPKVGQVAKSEWMYFTTAVQTAHSDVVVTLTELDSEASADCDLYVKYEAVPLLWNFDVANVSLLDTSTIHLSDARAGEYVVGVYGYTECSFRIVSTVSTSATCSNECSAHGDCVFDDECSCWSGFDGEICEWRRSPLALADTQTGYVGDSVWNYFTARIMSNSPLIVTMTIEEGDCDLYLKADEQPTRFLFDYIDLSEEETSSIVVMEPGDHLWYIGVYGWQACHYSLVMDEKKVCGCGENNQHGACEEGTTVCVCEEGWGGPSCSSELKIIENGVKTSSSVSKNGWKYFKVLVDQSSAGVVSLKEKSSKGFLWLFVSFVEPPTLNNFDGAAKETGSEIHEIQIYVAQPQSRVMYVGVYGNSYISHSEIELEFDLYAWSSPF